MLLHSKLEKMKYLDCKLWIIFIFLTTLVSLSNAIAIMSIDFGSEWMKVAVVAPGKPMEIALNFESKRKTPICISFRDGIRAFGEDACNTGMRVPNMNYVYLLDLLGKKADNPLVEMYKKIFPYYKIEADPVRGTVVFHHNDETTFSVEELVAQLLDHARSIAMAHSEQIIKDVVITVPSYFNQAERKALLDSADLAGLKVLSLLSTNAAVALNYGMFRRHEINETAQYILFYDMGAASTTASVAVYKNVNTKDKGYTETNPQVAILGVGFDRTLGGFEMQRRLRDFLAKEFNKVKKDKSKDVFESPRSMAKLLKAADKVRTVLSANSEHLVQVEGVLSDEDFSLKVKRETFEELNRDLFDRVIEPINNALVSASIDLKDIQQVLIVGGSTRVPKIKGLLQEYLKRKLGMSINADESAALGAVYKAADLGQGFKVKKFDVKECVLYPIEVTFERAFEKDDGSLDSKTVKRVLFSRGNSVPQKKVMTFNKHTTDFGFSVNYDLSDMKKQDLENFGSGNIAFFMVEGVTEAFKTYTNEDTTAKGIKAHFQIDDSGILNITGIEAIFEKNVTVEAEADESKEEESILSKISKYMTGSGDDETESEKTTDTTESPEEGSGTGEKPKETKTEKDKKDKEKKKAETDKDKESKNSKTKEKKPKTETIKVELTFKFNALDLKPMTDEGREASLKKLQDISNDDNTRKETEKIMNNMESLILDIKDKLEHEEYITASKEEERKTLEAKALELQEWLDVEEGSKAADYQDRVNILEKLFEPIRRRVRESRERPKALKDLKDMINSSTIFVNGLKEAAEKEKYLSDIIVSGLDEKITSTQEWIKTMEEEQEKLAPSDNPTITVTKIGYKITELNKEVQSVIKSVKIAKAMKEQEEAAAKKKEADAKAKAEKDAKKAEKKKKKNETETEEKQTTKAEGDSRQEPPMPEEDVADKPTETETDKPETKDEDKLAHEEI